MAFHRSALIGAVALRSARARAARGRLVVFVQTTVKQRALQAMLLYMALFVGVVSGYAGIRTAAQIAKRKAA